MKHFYPTIVCILFVSRFGVADDHQRLTFEQHVRPILKAQCFHCHGEAPELSGGLDVRLVRLISAGGDSGSAIAPGNAESSLLWQRIKADEMPEGPKKLSVEQKRIVREWIEEGARTVRPEPEDVREARFSEEELSHWAYQPIRRPRIPQPRGYELRNPIDCFIAARLAEHDFDFSPAADRRTLIRRATFDALGMPPSPEEIDAFVADRSPGAYERLVDRLLASPQFGVRWGRHWLDVAGYAETNGGQDTDTKREHAWRYRDYVVDSINLGKPADQFFIEQLAGDELLEGNIDIGSSRHLELLTATGFLRMAPDPTQTSNTLPDRNMAAADALKVISSAMLGITVGCAQCHDHKYDPIGIDDYYRFRAIFDPAFPLRDWQQPNSRLVDFTPQHVVAERERIEAEAKALEEDLNQRRNELGHKIQELKLADVPSHDRDATRAAVLTDPGKRTDEQRRLLDLYPMVKPVSNILGLLIEYDMPAYRGFEKEAERISALRATKPPQTMVMATRERAGIVPVSYVYFRGDPESPGDPVAPGELMVLNRHRHVQLPDDESGRPTTGRRLAYSRQLTDGTHPLTARVFVNRVWLHYFGRGLVATPGDFGISGEPPTHPELLDWLAHDFAKNNWDAKRLHRMILLSRTYLQTSRRRAHVNAVDPENELLGRMNVRRLEAEAIRDAIHFVIEGLDLALGGPSVPVTESPEGKVVIGRPTVRDGLKTGVDRSASASSRRSIYVETHRRLPLNMLATFDQPEMNPNCELRRPSTVATQSLWFLNDAEVIEHSERLADRLFRQAPNDSERIERLFVSLFASPPSETERQWCLEYLATQTKHLQSGAAQEPNAGQSLSSSAEWRAMATLCQMLFASNRFLYLD